MRVRSARPLNVAFTTCAAVFASAPLRSQELYYFDAMITGECERLVSNVAT